MTKKTHSVQYIIKQLNAAQRGEPLPGETVNGGSHNEQGEKPVRKAVASEKGVAKDRSMITWAVCYISLCLSALFPPVIKVQIANNLRKLEFPDSYGFLFDIVGKHTGKTLFYHSVNWDLLFLEWAVIVFAALAFWIWKK